jgi:hypothetical protein
MESFNLKRFPEISIAGKAKLREPALFCGANVEVFFRHDR